MTQGTNAQALGGEPTAHINVSVPVRTDVCAHDPVYGGHLPACRLAPPAPPSCGSKGSICGQGYPGSTCCGGLICEGGYYGTCASPPPASPRALATLPADTRLSNSVWDSAGILNKWPEGCELCSLAAATASLAQFYTRQQTPSNSLQCQVASTCENKTGPCCSPIACTPDQGTPDSGLGGCLNKADCLNALSVSSMKWQGSMFALKVITGKKMNASSAGSTGSLSPCKGKESPEGHNMAYADVDGNSFWYHGGKLTQLQVCCS